jgi:hypothetical protein
MTTTMTVVGVDMTLDQVASTVNGLVKQGSTAAHQIGTLYNYVVSRRLAEAAGYKTAQVFFNLAVRALSQATLSTYGAVARNFSEEVCTQYGVYHLRALLRYVEASGVAPGTDPGSLLIDVPVEGDKVSPKPFSACSVDEVERATRAKRAPPEATVPVSDKARLLFLADSLTRQFNGVAQVRFSSKSEEGQTLLNLQGVPMGEVPRLIQALQEGLAAQPSLAVR